MIIQADNISKAWEQSINFLLSSDIPLIYTQRGVRAKEYLGVQIVIDNPLKQPQISSKYIFGDLFVDNYCQNIMLASGAGQPSVGNRILRVQNVGQPINNQLDKVAKVLKTDSDSRRAIISLWDAKIDVGTMHPPCICTVQFFVRNGKLETIAYIRSNDSWMAALPDMVAVSLLSKTIAEKIEVKVGRYTHFAANYHIYEPDIMPALQRFSLKEEYDKVE